MQTRSGRRLGTPIRTQSTPIVDAGPENGWVVERNAKFRRKSLDPAKHTRSVGHLTGRGSMVVAVRRNIGNMASGNLGSALLVDISGQTVRRCEQDAAGELKGPQGN
eukprot:36227-Pyramimonas_sp.AAC.1